MKNNNFKTMLVISSITILISVSISPMINGGNLISDYNDNRFVDNNVSSLSFFGFDRSGIFEKEVFLPKDSIDFIIGCFEELQCLFKVEPFSDETQMALIDFIDLLDVYDLIPDDLSREDVFSLVNPSWVRFLHKILGLTDKSPFVRGSTLNKLNDFVNGDLDVEGMSSDISFLCNIASIGTGIPLPFFMLPRPRGLVMWGASNAATAVGSLLQAKNFVAYGNQQGVGLGFVGFGISAFFGWFVYALVGYASVFYINAEEFEFFTPPNNVPEVSDEFPSDGAVDVPVSLEEISFRIFDDDGDRMSYSVSSSPDVGSGSGILKKNGVYSVPVSGLEANTGYIWTVEVSDGKDAIVKNFSFYTEMLPFDPFEEGWCFRKMITVDHDLVEGDLFNFPVLVSVVDGDLAVKAQFDGDDVLFMDDVGVASRLFHEIEFFDGSVGELVCWVRLPVLDGDVDSVFYLYYGNPSCDDQQYPSMVWESNYIAVYHMNYATGDIIDSTYNKNEFSVVNPPTYLEEGKIGYSMDFDGNQDYFQNTNMNLKELSEFTLTAWIQPDTITGEKQCYIFSSKYDTDNDIRLAYHPGGNDNSGFSGVYDDGVVDGVIDYTNTFLVDNWYFYASTCNNNLAESRLYMNDDCVGIDDSVNFKFNNLNNKHRIGHRAIYNTPKYFDGCIDEIKISKNAREQDWIITEYNNQYIPSNFVDIGIEETGP